MSFDPDHHKKVFFLFGCYNTNSLIFPIIIINIRHNSNNNNGAINSQCVHACVGGEGGGTARGGGVWSD